MEGRGWKFSRMVKNENMKNQLLNNFKEKLRSGKSVFGPFMKTADPAFVEATGYAGFDFVILDMEHGPVSLEAMQNNVRAAIVAGIVPIIRTRDRQAESVSQALDIGALGIQVPQITTTEEVENIIKAARFSPKGERGVCRFVRAAEYSSLSGAEYFENANQSLLIVQVEGKKALDNIDKILQMKEVDVFFIGPYDLSQSLGVPGQIDHPSVLKVINQLLEEAQKRSCALGVFADNTQDALKWKKFGLNYISYSVDVGIYYSACKDLSDLFHE